MLKTGPIGPLLSVLSASPSPPLFFYLYMSQKKPGMGREKEHPIESKNTNREYQETARQENKKILTRVEPANQEGYSSVTISMYFCIASSGGIAPNFCHACLPHNNQWKKTHTLSQEANTIQLPIQIPSTLKPFIRTHSIYRIVGMT